MTMIIDGSTGLEFPDGSDQTSAFTGNAATITSGTLAIANGGTNATSASSARTNLGLAIGTDVLAPTGTGTGLTALNGSNVTSGTIATARLASGSANSSTYLRGDQTWATISGGVTSLNGETGAITNTSYGAIGSYVIGHSTTFTGGGYYAANQTCAGNTLIGQNNLGGGSSQSLNIRNNGTSVYIPFGTYSLGLTGTWRSMTNFQSPDANEGATALWVRIS